MLNRSLSKRQYTKHKSWEAVQGMLIIIFFYFEVSFLFEKCLLYDLEIALFLHILRNIMNKNFAIFRGILPYWVKAPGNYNFIHTHEAVYLSRCSDELRTGRTGFDFRQGKDIFFYSTASRPALWPTQSPIQWVLGTLSSGGGGGKAAGARS
jgi:hypothetical protein